MRRSFLPLAFSLLSLSSNGQDMKLSPLEALKAEMYKLQDDPDLIHGTWGLCVLDLKRDTVIAEYNSATGFVPASSLKVLTTGAALSILGENYRYETKIQYDGILDSLNGIIYGNLYILGSGDPSLGSKFFQKEKDTIYPAQRWANLLRSRGIRKIEGAIIADAGVFDSEMVPDNWTWGDIGNYYGAGPSGLNYRDNQYHVYYSSGNEGDTARITRVVPVIPGLKMESTVKAGGTKDYANFYGAPYSNFRYASGTIPPHRTDFEVDVSMPDPAFYCAYELDSVLRKNHVTINGRPTTTREVNALGSNNKKHRFTLFSEYSPKLSDLVYWTNKKSVNLYAESMLKTIAHKKNGIGTVNGGTDAIGLFLTYRKIDIKGLHMNDGSGLSRSNSITPRQFVSILRLISKEPCFKAYYKSFPEYTANVVAKGGYITRVRSYTGFITKKNGELLAFSIIANNYDCTPVDMVKKMEKLLDLMGQLE
jgi:D-alanyl-D-alanine carboxypeptidase/D-alanyl-D-alanine-endopeptidase (penicillin-binding protein 4)